MPLPVGWSGVAWGMLPIVFARQFCQYYVEKFTGTLEIDGRFKVDCRWCSWYVTICVVRIIMNFRVGSKLKLAAHCDVKGGAYKDGLGWVLQGNCVLEQNALRYRMKNEIYLMTMCAEKWTGTRLCIAQNCSLIVWINCSRSIACSYLQLYWDQCLLQGESIGIQIRHWQYM